MLKNIKKNKKYGYVVTALLCLGIATPNFCQYQVSSLAARLMEEMQLSESAFSSIATAPLFMGIFLGFTSGMLTDRFGIKMLLISVAVTTLGVCLRTVAGGYAAMYISMMMMGFSASFVNSTTPKIMGGWFEPSKVTIMTGVVLAASGIAMALGSGTAVLFDTTRGAFVFAAVCAAAVLALWCVFMPSGIGGENMRDSGEKASFRESVSVVLKSRKVWVCALCAFSMVACSTGCNIFTPQALMSRGMSEKSAGLMSMAISAGNMLAGLGTPIVIKYLGGTKKRLRLMMLAYTVLAVALTALAWRAPEGIVLALCLFGCGYFVMGFAGFILTLPMYLPEVGKRYSATGSGLVLTVQLIGAVVVPTYIAAPIAGSNFRLLYYIFALFVLLFGIFSRFVPLDDYFRKQEV
ncbi:MAG: MFS transporter [Oscillospiraceae bacterium]|jgi:cyanate permease|nr:MFS transporter [Oscillospiraceae bacterium]